MGRFTLIAGDQDITDRMDGLSFSNTDPGGHEILQCNPQVIQGLQAGRRLTLYDGSSVAWDGRINEPGQTISGRKVTYQIGGVGYAAGLKDNPYKQIYLSSDMSQWKAASTARQKAEVTAGFSDQNNGQVLPDATSGTPSMLTRITGAWGAAVKPVTAAWFDANGIPIDSLYYSWNKGANIVLPDASWDWDANLTSDDIATAVDTSGNLSGAGPGTGTVSASGNRPFAMVQLFYNAASSGTEGMGYDVFWPVLVAYGRHGLPKRGSASASSWQGFYPSDIARDAARRSKQPLDMIITEASSYDLLHSVYMAPTGADQIIGDMANLMAWHWGVWEPRTMFDTVPTFYFQPPPSDATCVISMRDCIEIDVPKVRMDLLYDTALVNYTDIAGSTNTVTVTLANPLLQQAGATGRTMVFDMGVGSSAAASVLGRMALQLAQRTARGGGSVTVPGNVTLTGGGAKPSTLLKSGRDRIRVTDLPDAGPMHEIDTRRFDTFHVRRVETTVSPQGVPQTRVEFDDGADLLEVLQARLAIATKLAGG